MAIVDYDPLFNPLRGKILGTVFQTGRYAPVIKSHSPNQGQRLTPFNETKHRFAHASNLWRSLSPAAQTAWDVASPSFPTVDRYGNPATSTGFNLFLRCMGALPISRQFPLAAPDPPYADPIPAPPILKWSGSALELQVMSPPGFNQFNTALFCTRLAPLSWSHAKPSFRQIYYEGNHGVIPAIDVTSEYEHTFEPIETGTRIFWCVKTWKSQTPELINVTCGSVDFVTPLPDFNDLVLYLDSTLADSYPGSGVSWFDLSNSGHVFTLVNAPSWLSDSTGRFFRFNGTSQCAELAASLLNSGSFEIVILLKKGSTTSFKGLLEWRFATNRRTGTGYDNNNPLATSFGSFARYTNVAPVGSWHMLNVTGTVLGNTNRSARHNLNNLTFVNQQGTAIAPTGNLTRIADFTTAARFYLAMDLAVVLVYNKILTPAQRTTIYDIYKTRFSLP